MSLMERVEQADGYVPTVQMGPTVALLRQQVQKIVPAESIARLASDQPDRARSEIRSACRQVFSLPEWAEVSPVERASLVDQLMDSVFGLGPIEALLADESVTEIMVNGARSIFYEQAGVLHQSELSFADDDQVRALIDRIIGPLGRRIDESSPMVNARLPQGHRVNAIIPPLALDGPILTIRTFTQKVMTLDEMEERGSFSWTVKQMLIWAVLARKNIAVSGGTGSGKTTLLNALSCHISPDERIITIEDSAELRFLNHPHVVRLEARPCNAEGSGEVSIRDLVTNALRMRPDRIIVGECRGGEALDMLQAMNTGHDGSLTTLHANSPMEVMGRLVTMVRYAADLPVDVIESHIASAFDLVVQTARDISGQRFISEIAEVSFDEDRRICTMRPLFVRSNPEEKGEWYRIPDWIEPLVRAERIEREEVLQWLQSLDMKLRL